MYMNRIMQYDIIGMHRLEKKMVLIQVIPIQNNIMEV